MYYERNTSMYLWLCGGSYINTLRDEQMCAILCAIANSLREKMYIPGNLCLRSVSQHKESAPRYMMRQVAVETRKFDISCRRVYSIAHSSDALYEIYTNCITVSSTPSWIQFRKKYKLGWHYTVYHFRTEKSLLQIYFPFACKTAIYYFFFNHFILLCKMQ